VEVEVACECVYRIWRLGGEGEAGGAVPGSECKFMCALTGTGTIFLGDRMLYQLWGNAWR
jgi:hypothetical protein